MPFEFRREVLDLCFLKKCLKGFIDLNNSKAVLSKGRFRRYVFKFLLFDHIVDLWNSLPVAIKIITDQLFLFSNKVNEFYIDEFNPNNERFMFRVQVSISVYLIST